MRLIMQALNIRHHAVDGQRSGPLIVYGSKCVTSRSISSSNFLRADVKPPRHSTAVAHQWQPLHLNEWISLFTTLK